MVLALFRGSLTGGGGGLLPLDWGSVFTRRADGGLLRSKNMGPGLREHVAGVTEPFSEPLIACFITFGCRSSQGRQRCSCKPPDHDSFQIRFD